MRVLLFFDLPTETGKERREYAKFRKFLLGNGFIMMQKSVYSKLVINQNSVDAVLERVRQNSPPEGIIQTLVITEKQYGKMEFILGSSEGDVLNTDERFVEI